jgi:hypothetical protein
VTCNGASIEGDIVIFFEAGGGDVVVLFSYTNLHCTCENMLFWKRVDQLWPRLIGWQGSRSAISLVGNGPEDDDYPSVCDCCKAILSFYSLRAIVSLCSITRRLSNEC